MSLIRDTFRALSKGEGKSLEKEYELIGNCFGFLSVKGGMGTSTFINELATYSSAQGLHTCIVDCNPLSTFYLAKYINNIEEHKEVPSIGNRLSKHSCPITDCLINVSPTLKLLTFGDLPYSVSFSLDKQVLKTTLEELKSVFDLVLLDIPNYPWNEYTLEAIQCSSTIYSVLGYGYDSMFMFEKLKTLLKYAGLQNKINQIIFMSVPKGTSLKSGMEDFASGSKVIVEVPEVSKIKRASLEYDSILNNISGSEMKSYASCLSFIFNEIANGISDKSSAKEGD